MTVDRIASQRYFQDIPKKTRRGIRAEMNNITINDGVITSNSTGKDVTDRYNVLPTVNDTQIRRMEDVDEL